MKDSSNEGTVDGFIPGGRGGSIRPRQKGDPAPPGAGRPLGSLNFKTIAKRLLHATTKVENPLTGVVEDISLYEQLVMGQLQKAILGQDTQAFNAIMDRYEGKNVQYIGQVADTTEVMRRFENMTTDDIRDVLNGKYEETPPSDDTEYADFEEIKTTKNDDNDQSQDDDEPDPDDPF